MVNKQSTKRQPGEPRASLLAEQREKRLLQQPFKNFFFSFFWKFSQPCSMRRISVKTNSMATTFLYSTHAILQAILLKVKSWTEFQMHILTPLELDKMFISNLNCFRTFMLQILEESKSDQCRCLLSCPNFLTSQLNQ